MQSESLDGASSSQSSRSYRLPIHSQGVYLNTRIDHVRWRCHRMTCLGVNDMPHHRCSRCHNKMGTSDHALNIDNAFIGILLLVDEDDDEFWYYPDVLAIRDMYWGMAKRVRLKFGSPPPDFRPGGIDGIDRNNDPHAAGRSGNPRVDAQNKMSAPLGNRDAVGTNGEGGAARNGDMIEVRHMGGGVENGRNGETDDEDLDEPEEQEEEETPSKRRGKQPARQARSQKRKNQPENEGNAQGGAAGRGNGKRKRRA